MRIRILLLVGTGGFIGSVLRFYLSQFIQNKYLSAFPYGTLGVNMLGCFAIGCIFAFAEKGDISLEWRMFLAVGLCGGFTTFSAFSLETMGLMKMGQLLPAFLYILASVALGLAATFVGIALVKFF